MSARHASDRWRVFGKRAFTVAPADNPLGMSFRISSKGTSSDVLAAKALAGEIALVMNLHDEMLTALKEARSMANELECRADEDCDHCQLVHHVLDPVIAKAEGPKTGGGE